MIKGCNIFWGVKNWQIFATLWADALSCNKKKISRAERSWTNPFNMLQEAIHYSRIKFYIYCFSFWYEFFVQYAWRVEKIYQHVLDEGPLEFQFLPPRGDLTNPFRTLSLCFGAIGKTTGLIPVIILLKNFFVCIGHRVNVLARCDSIFPLPMCLGLWKKTWTQLSLPQILFHSPKTYSLGDAQRFFHHFLCDSTVIFDQINNSSNVYFSLSRFWTATSLVIFYQLPSVSKWRMPPKNV